MSENQAGRVLGNTEMLQMSMGAASWYVNNTVYTSAVGGIKLTFIERSPEGMVFPRVSVFLPLEYLKQFHADTGEFIKRLESLTVQPATPTTTQ